MYPELPDDARNLLFTLCEQARKNIKEGVPAADVNRIHIKDLDSYLSRIRILEAAGAIQSVDKAKMVTLTPHAFLMEQYLKNRAQDKADKKRQQRFDNKIAMASVLIPLITFILGLFVEHWAGIAQWFLSLF